MAASTPDTFFQVLTHACTEIRRGFDRHVGMSQPRRQLLALLAEQGETSHAALANLLAVDGAAVTRLVKALESEGAVRRRLDPADNRYTLASLTEAGEALVAHLHAAHHHYQAHLLTNIPHPDQQTVIRVLQQLRTNIHHPHPTE